MPRKSQLKRRQFSNGRSGPLAVRKSRRLSPVEQEAVVRTFFTVGTVTGTAAQMGCSVNAVRASLREMQNDPSLANARAQALDEMAGKIHAITDRVMDSITPDELVTTRHEVRDRNGALMRVVTDGPTLKDKAFAIGILADKQKVLLEARTRAADAAHTGSSTSGMLLPETIEGKMQLVASMVKRLRVVDVFMHDPEVQGSVSKLAKKVGVREQDIEDAELEAVSGMAPFD